MQRAYPGDGRRRVTASPPIASGSCVAPASQVDSRRVAQVALGIVLGTLAVLGVVFTVVGIHTNQQIDRLHNQGVPVTFTVTGCLGLLGGSGSNAAGYSCRGTYSARRPPLQRATSRATRSTGPGSTVAAIAVPGDPALVSPAAIVNTEHSSASVFVLPAVLAASVLVLSRRRWSWWRRRRTAATGTA